MGIPQVPFSSLVQAMTGSDCLNGWDCLVSYTEKQINNLLAERAAALPPNVQKIDPFTTKSTIMKKYTVTYTVNMTLGTPTLQFMGGDATVQVTFPIGGTYTTAFGTDEPDNEPLPDGLVVVVTTSLINVDGLGPAIPSKTQAASAVVFFDSNDPQHTSSICINFQHPNSVSVQNAPNLPSGQDPLTDLVNVSSAMGTAIENHFSNVGMQYYLAGLSNEYDTSDASSVVLRPTSFCFTTVASDDANNVPGALSMWIAVAGGSGNGTSQSRQTSVSFSPGGKTSNPLPTGSTASIIFSHDLMANIFFKPGFMANGMKNVNCTSTNGTKGMTFTGALPSNTITINAYDDKQENGLIEYKCDGTSFNINDPLATFSLAPDIPSQSAPSMTVEWQSPTHSLDWSYFYDPVVLFPTQTHGTAEVAFNFSGTAKWVAGTASNMPNTLGMTFSWDQNCTVSATGDQASAWQQYFAGASSSVPYYYTNLKVAVPTFQMNMKALNYFLATNLLFPGDHVFIADPPIPASGSEKGIASPRDTILTGQITDSLAKTPSTGLQSQPAPPASSASLTGLKAAESAAEQQYAVAITALNSIKASMANAQAQYQNASAAINAAKDSAHGFSQIWSAANIAAAQQKLELAKQILETAQNQETVAQKDADQALGNVNQAKAALAAYTARNGTVAQKVALAAFPKMNGLIGTKDAAKEGTNSTAVPAKFSTKTAPLQSGSVGPPVAQISSKKPATQQSDPLKDANAPQPPKNDQLPNGHTTAPRISTIREAFASHGSVKSTIAKSVRAKPNVKEATANGTITNESPLDRTIAISTEIPTQPLENTKPPPTTAPPSAPIPTNPTAKTSTPVKPSFSIKPVKTSTMTGSIGSANIDGSRKVVAELTAVPFGQMTADLMNALAQDDPKSINSTVTGLLKQHGYGDVTGEDFMALYGVTYDDFAAVVPVTTVALQASVTKSDTSLTGTAPGKALSQPVTFASKHPTSTKSSTTADSNAKLFFSCSCGKTFSWAIDQAEQGHQSKTPRGLVAATTAASKPTTRQRPVASAPVKAKSVQAFGKPLQASTTAEDDVNSDLSVYAGVYLFDPAKDNNHLGIYPPSEVNAEGQAKVNCDGEDVYAMATGNFDESGQHRYFSWTTTKRTYVVYFWTSFDLDESKMTYKFKGYTVTTDESKKSAVTAPISGEQDTELADALNWSSWGATIGGLLLTFLILGIQTRIQNNKEKASKEEDVRLREADLARLDQQDRAIGEIQEAQRPEAQQNLAFQRAQLTKASDRYAQRMNKEKLLDATWQTMSDELVKNTNSDMRSSPLADDITAEDAIAFSRHMNGEDVPIPESITAIIEVAQKAAADRAVNSAANLLNPKIDDLLADFPNYYLFDSNTIGEVTQGSAAKIAKPKADALTTTADDTASAVQQIASSILLQHANDVLTAMSADLERQLAPDGPLRSKATQTRGEVDGTTQHIQELQSQLQSNDPLDPENKGLEDQIGELEKQLEAQTKADTAAQKEITDAEGRKGEVDRQAEEANRKSGSESHEGTERAREILVGE